MLGDNDHTTSNMNDIALRGNRISHSSPSQESHSNSSSPLRPGIINLSKLSDTNIKSNPSIGTRLRNARKKRKRYIIDQNVSKLPNHNSNNSNDHINSNNRNNIDDDEDDKVFSLQEDIFTIMFVSPLFSLAFAYGFIIYFFQICILVLGTVNLLRGVDPGNSLNIPLNIEKEVIFAQSLAIIVSVFTAKDIIHAMDVLQVEYSYSILDVFPFATMKKWYLCNILRLLMGIMGLLVSFIFIVQSTDVLDLFLDFAVVQFVSELDDLGFYLAARGYSFINLKKVTRTSTKIKFRQKDFVNFCGTRWVIPTSLSQRILFFLTLFSCFIGWGSIQYFQQKGYYYETVCQKFEINFDDFELDFFRDHCNNDEIDKTNCPSSWIGRTEPIQYTSFNDVYEAQINEGLIVLKNDRPMYHQRGIVGSDAFGEDSPGGLFFYCEEEEAWVFTIPGVSKGIVDEKDGGCNWLMKSLETDAHSLHQVETEGWIVWTGILKVVEDFSISCIECEGSNDTVDVMCTYHGKCVKERCVCDKYWMGNQCETCVSCQKLGMDYGSISTYFHRLDKDDTSTIQGTSPLQVYGRPVYYRGDAYGNVDPRLEIILYVGRYYVVWDLKEDETVNIADDLVDLQEFLSTLHSTWDFGIEAKLKLSSEHTDNPMPFGLNWFYSDGEEVDINLKCLSDAAEDVCFYAFN